MSVTLSEKDILKEKMEYTGVHPQKFALWLAMAAMTMFFAALTSALLVKKGDYQVWENFELPKVFIYSTVAVVTTSVLIHGALICYRQARFFAFRSLLFLSFITGLLFLGLQYLGWKAMTAMGMTLTGNISASFIYLITAAHGAHIVLGLLVSLIVLVKAIRSRKDPLYELRDSINPKRQLNMEMLVSYWHFIDLVWIYLYVFFLMNYQ